MRKIVIILILLLSCTLFGQTQKDSLRMMNQQIQNLTNQLSIQQNLLNDYQKEQRTVDKRFSAVTVTSDLIFKYITIIITIFLFCIGFITFKSKSEIRQYIIDLEKLYDKDVINTDFKMQIKLIEIEKVQNKLVQQTRDSLIDQMNDLIRAKTEEVERISSLELDKKLDKALIDIMNQSIRYIDDKLKKGFKS